MNSDIWTIAEEMADELREFSNAACEAGSPLPSLDNLLMRYSDCVQRRMNQFSSPLCFADDLVGSHATDALQQEAEVAQREGRLRDEQSARRLLAELEGAPWLMTQEGKN